MDRMIRRDFLKMAGGLACASAVYTFLPGVTFAGDKPGAVLAASSVEAPSFIAPSIILPGQSIPFAAASSPGMSIDKLWIINNSTGETIELERGTENGAEKLAGMKSLEPGLYDFYTQVSKGGKSRVERQPHAVMVVESFKKDFKFGAISDVHFGDPRIKQKIPDFSVEKTVRKEIEILKENGIEFCICCGDLCNIPPSANKEIIEYTELLTEHATFPVFSVPGNHDGYATGVGGKISYDTFKKWNGLFGSFTHSASYGAMSLVGVNTFDKAPNLRNLYAGHGEEADMGAMTPEQLEWLDTALTEARAQNAESIIMYGHHNPTNSVVDVNGMFRIEPFSEAGRRELLDLVEKHKPDAFFVGHVHGVFEEKYANTTIHTVPTAASSPMDDHKIGIDIVTVKDNKITSLETIVTEDRV